MKQCQFPAPGAQRLLSKCNWKSSVLSFLIVPPTLLFCQSQVPKISHASGPPPQSFPPLKDIGVSDRGDSLGVVCKLVCLRQFSLCSPCRFDFPVLGLQMGSVSGGLACTFLWAWDQLACSMSAGLVFANPLLQLRKKVWRRLGRMPKIPNSSGTRSDQTVKNPEALEGLPVTSPLSQVYNNLFLGFLPFN